VDVVAGAVPQSVVELAVGVGCSSAPALLPTDSSVLPSVAGISAAAAAAVDQPGPEAAAEWLRLAAELGVRQVCR